MEDYLEFAKGLALEAGEIMRRYFLNVEKTWKSDATPLTLADTEINDLVIRRVNDAYPDHSVYGEEKSSLKESKYLWVCDPVDGTLPYSHGLPISTFSLALVVDGVSTVGVVYDPFMERLFYAAINQGAYCNNKPIQVSDNDFDNGLIEVQGFGHATNLRRELSLSNSIKDILISNGAKTTQLWSVVLPSVLVANGDYIAVIFNGKTVQDGAAVKIIVEEAGGRVTDIHGNEQRYDEISKGFVASNGIVHDEIIKVLKEAHDEV